MTPARADFALPLGNRSQPYQRHTSVNGSVERVITDIVRCAACLPVCDALSASPGRKDDADQIADQTGASQVSAAQTNAETPVSIVGPTSGAKKGEWLLGTSRSTVPACAAAR
jgi:hypothetical protein